MTNYQPPSVTDELPEQPSHQPAQDTNNGANGVNNINDPSRNAQDFTPETRLEIVFEGTNGHVLKMKMKVQTPFKKAMDVYSQRTQMQRSVLRFLFDGERVLDDSTPGSLGMEDGDQVDVHMEQIGGCESLL